MNRLERVVRDKHSSLVRKSVNYGQKSFMTLAPSLWLGCDLNKFEPIYHKIEERLSERQIFVQFYKYFTTVTFNCSKKSLLGRKQLVYQVKKFGILSLFVSIHFKIDRIVRDRPNITIT
jgi:hypothetical protein